jgi:hypothetical protein
MASGLKAMRGGAPADAGQVAGELKGSELAVVPDPSHSLLAPALFDCFCEETRSISSVRSPSAGSTRNFGRGLWVSWNRTSSGQWYAAQKRPLLLPPSQTTRLLRHALPPSHSNLPPSPSQARRCPLPPTRPFPSHPHINRCPLPLTRRCPPCRLVARSFSPRPLPAALLVH